MQDTGTAIAVSTYHRTMLGGGRENLLRFKEQDFDRFFVLFDNKTSTSLLEISKVYGDANLCVYTEMDLLASNLCRPIDKRHRWGSHSNPNYFYAHHRMLLFYLRNPHFEYYWFFDDDVTFSGDLRGFIAHYDKIPSDFLAVQVHKKDDYIEFPYVSRMNSKMASGGSWWRFAPGPGDNYPNFKYHMGSYFPIVRFSNAALNCLLDANISGYFGYSEGFVPTAIANSNMPVISILDENDAFFHPANVNCELFHKGQKFSWARL